MTTQRSTRWTNKLRRIAAVSLGAAALGVLAWKGDPAILVGLGYLPAIVVGLVAGKVEPEAVAGLLQWETIWPMASTVVLLCAAWWCWPTRRLLDEVDDRRLRHILKVSVVVAALIPVGYAITRIAWALGIPLGLDADFLESIQDIVLNGLLLSGGAIGGAVLTVGLTRPWGTTFPRWMPFVGGRAVPVGLARNSALVVALAVTSAGFYFVRERTSGGLGGIGPAGAENQIAAWLPEMFWPLWGIALATAAIAYGETRWRSAVSSKRMPTPVAA